MRSCHASAGVGLVLIGVLAACGTPRPPAPAELAPLRDERPARAPLPDTTERGVGRLAALVLADRPDSAAVVLEEIEGLEAERRARGEAPTGLLDNAHDVFRATAGQRAYAVHAERLLERDDLDPAVRRRVERWQDSQPLAIAERRVREDRVRKTGSVFNRLAAPLSRLFLGASLNPVESTRAALASLLTVHSFPTATPQERQALRAYQEFLEHDPDAPEAARIVERVERYREKWRRHLHAEALDLAERSLEAGRPDVALVHLDRAARLRPESRAGDDLRARATAALQTREAEVARSLSAAAPADLAAEGPHALLTAVLIAPPGGLVLRAEEARRGPGGERIAAQLDFLQALEPRSHGDEAGFARALETIAGHDPARDPMARHARAILADPRQNPWAWFTAERDRAQSRGLAWLVLGSRMHGPIRRDLPLPAEWLLDLPGLVVSVLTTPLRLLRYPTVVTRFSPPVLEAGETYLARFPHGEHAEQVRAELEDRYAARGQVSRALEHHRGRLAPDLGRIARYRGRIADGLLASAEQQRRVDVRVSLYRSVLEEYADLPQAAQAREGLALLLTEYTPQRIRLSREFLRENPRLWQREGLGLRPELLDEEEENGELAEEGVTLLGQTRILLPLEGREPQVMQIPPERFTRFVGLLEETSYQRLATDARERPAPDPQRDLFFERARLGLLDQPDVRPTASSEAVFLGTREKFGQVRQRESLLPVELVVQGGLTDLAVAAFPRIKLPRSSPDAFLYE